MFEGQGENRTQRQGSRRVSSHLPGGSSAAVQRPRPRFAAQVALHGSKATYFSPLDCGPQMQQRFECNKNRTWYKCEECATAICTDCHKGGTVCAFKCNSQPLQCPIPKVFILLKKVGYRTASHFTHRFLLWSFSSEIQ